MFNKKNTAVILGLSETGLGIGKSLGRHGIRVYGISYQKEIAYYSKYINSILLPHPINQELEFIKYIGEFCNTIREKPVLFIAADEYLNFYIRNNSIIDKYFISNLPGQKLVKSIADKYSQYELAVNSGIDVPKTLYLDKFTDINEIKNNIDYPIFIKGRDVNLWRKVFISKKGFVINDDRQLKEKLKVLSANRVPIIVQELVLSADNQNYKICVYISPEGKYKLVFTLRKIHQNPIHSGIGSSVESFKYPLLEKIGMKLFSAINYQGVGSAEFKYDEKDGKLKLIEINPRYWQQNLLADYCGMNFPLIDYLQVTGQSPDKIDEFREKIKWVNISADFDSYLKYKKEGTISFSKWLKDLKGEKIISNFSWDDKAPFFFHYYSRFNIIGRIKNILGIKRERKSTNSNK